MIIGKNKKDILNLLLYRWKALAGYSALEKIHNASNRLAKQLKINLPNEVSILETKPTSQIELIRQKIVEILPEASSIDINYEAPAALQPQDFMELYISHQEICLQYIKNLMIKNDIK